MPTSNGKVTIEGCTLDDLQTAINVLDLKAVDYANEAKNCPPRSIAHNTLMRFAARCELVAGALRRGTGL